MLALVFDALQLANWQRAGDVHAPRPRPLLAPGDVDPDSQGIGSGAIPISQFDAWWDAPPPE